MDTCNLLLKEPRSFSNLASLPFFRRHCKWKRIIIYFIGTNAKSNFRKKTLTYMNRIRGLRAPMQNCCREKMRTGRVVKPNSQLVLCRTT